MAEFVFYIVLTKLSGLWHLEMGGEENLKIKEVNVQYFSLLFLSFIGFSVRSEYRLDRVFKIGTLESEERTKNRESRQVQYIHHFLAFAGL